MKANVIFALFSLIVLLGIGTAGAGTITGVTLTSNVSSTTYFNQPILLTATVSGGSGNYNYNYFVDSKSFGTSSSSSPNSIIFKNGGTFTVSGLTTFNVIVTNVSDSSNVIGTASTQVTIGSTNSTTVTVSPSYAVVDVGQTLPITVTLNNGKSPYSLTLYSGLSATCSSDTSVVTTASDVSSSFTFNAAPTNNGINGTTVYYCVKAVDSNSYSSYSGSIPVTVYNAISGAIYGTSNGVGYYTSMDEGQSQQFTATPTGGTGSYYYSWQLGNSISESGQGGIGGFQTFNSPMLNSPGTYQLSLKISDTGTKYATNPAEPNVTLTGGIITVYPFSVKLSASNTSVDQNQSETLTANVFGGSGVGYNYVFYYEGNKIGNVLTKNKTASITFIAEAGGSSYQVRVFDLGVFNGPGNYTQNSTNVTIYHPISISQPVNEIINMDIGQVVPYAGSIKASGGSGSITITPTSFYGGQMVPYNSLFASNGTFMPNAIGTYNVSFAIHDVKTGYTIYRVFSAKVYGAPQITATISNAINADGSWQTDAGQVITYHLSSTGGGTGSNVIVYLRCAPSALDTMVDCYLSPFTGSGSSYSAPVLLTKANDFSNTISLKTINSPASLYNFSIYYSDIGTSSYATPQNLFSQNTTISTEPTLSDVMTPTASNVIIDQGQSSNVIVNFGSAQGGILPFNWNWIYNVNNSKYGILNSCPKGVISSVADFPNAATYCMFNTNTSTKIGIYNFKLNTTDSANYSTLTNPITVKLNKALNVAVNESSNVIDVNQVDMLYNITTGGTAPYKYQWLVKAPGSNSFVNINGAINQTYKFAPVGNAIGTYEFELTATDSASTPVTKTSTPIVVIVNPDPTVSITPATNTIMDVGQSVTFMATATSGTGTPSTYKYQWYTISGSTNTIIKGATSSTYTYIPTTNTITSIGVMAVDNVNFTVNTTNVANIIVYPLQTVAVQIPSNTYMDVGQTTTLVSTVSGGTGSFSYLWTISPPGSTLPLCPGITSSNSNTIIYTPSSGGLCTIQVAVDDIGTSSYATPQSVVVGIFNPITIYSAPYLSDLTPSNAIIDLGQSETFNVVINGGSNKDMSISLYQSPQNNVLTYVTGAGDGVQTFRNFVPTLSENTFYVNGLDSGVTTPFDIPPISFTYIKINQAPTSTISASNSSIHANQESTLTSNIIGGTPAYSYQWYMKAPGSSTYSVIPNANKPTFLFNISTMTIGGTYNFRLVTTDSASTPETFNSTNTISINVNNTFTSNMLVLDVNAIITNDPDSGNFGYWALDNITRNIKVYQTAIPSGPLVANSYVANIVDTGIATTFAGAISPGAGVVEPNNGIANMIGYDQLSFNATFTPNSNPVYTNGNYITSLNNGGTSAFILLGNYSKQTTPIQSTFEYYLSKYFTITGGQSNYSFTNWGDTYTYNVYPPGGQVMTDNSISSPSITGDIVTYTVPTVTLSQPSAAVLDSGQSETYSATVYNGIGPFLVELFPVGSNIPIVGGYIHVYNGAGTSGNSITFNSFVPPIGTDSYYVHVMDIGTPPPNKYMFSSSSNTITVYSDPTSITNIITPTTMDVGQNIPISVSVTGGTGMFSYLWTVASGTTPTSICPGFTSSTSNAFIYTPTSQTSNCNFEVTVKDIGVSSGATPITPYTIDYASAGPITVYANLTKIVLSPSNVVMDVGQSVAFTANVFGGTSSSNYVYTWYDNGNVINSCTTSICVYSPLISGAKNITVNVKDSGTTTPPAEPAENVTASTQVMVYNKLGTISVSPIIAPLDLNQYLTFTANSVGGTGNYLYQWYNDTTGTPMLISGATSNTYIFNANTPSIVTAYSGVNKLYNGSSASYGPFKIVLNQIKPAGYPFDDYMSVSIFYNNMLEQDSVLFLPVGGTYQYTVPGTSNTINISVTNINSDSNGLYVDMVLGIPTVTYYRYYVSVADAGTSNAAISQEVSNSVVSSAYVNNALVFSYNENKNIVTDVGFGYGSDVGMSFLNGTEPYSILGVNTIIDAVPSTDGVSLCSDYVYFVQPSCSFGVATNAIPGNYVIPISASDSSKGLPVTNVTENVNVQVNPDVNAISNGFISNVILDPTQQYSYTMNAFGGTLPYSYSWQISYIETLHFGSFTFNEFNSDSPIQFSNITVLNGCGGPFGEGMGLANNTCAFVAENATNGPVEMTAVVTDNAMFGGAFTPPFGKVLLNSNITIENTPIITVVPSNSSLDQNQYETYTISVNGGAGPFNVNFYNTTGGTEKLVKTFTISSGSSNIITFEATKTGIFSYNAIATDIGTTMPYTFNSSTSTISVAKPLGTTQLIVSGKYFDQGQTVDLSANVPIGGTPAYNYKFVATNTSTGSNLFTCNWQTNSCSFSASQTGSFYGNVIVSDSASTPEISQSTNNAMFIVNPDMGPLSISVSNSIIPLGGSEIVSSSIIGGGGTVPYTYTYSIYNATTNKLVYTTTTSSTNAISNSILYTPIAKGYYYVKAVVYDSASPAETDKSGESNIFLVGSASSPSVFITPNSKIFSSSGAAEYDSGQTIGYNVQIFGGIGPYNVTLYNVTGNNVYSKQSNVLANALGGATLVTFSIPANTLSSLELTYNAIVVDNGAIPPITFNSTDSNIIVNPALGSNVTLSNKTIDIGQSTTITANIHGGTPPYNFTYYVNGNQIYKASKIPSANGNVLVPTINSYSASWNTLSNVGGISSAGIYTVNVLVTDNVSDNETLSNTIIVNNALMPATLMLSSNALTDGSTLTMYASNVIGGTAPYAYNFELYNSTSNALISQSGYQSLNSSSLSITNSMNGADYAIVLVKDNVGMITTSNSMLFDASAAPSTPTGGGSGGSGGGTGTGGGGASGGIPAKKTVPNIMVANTINSNMTVAVGNAIKIEAFNTTNVDSITEIVVNRVLENYSGSLSSGLTYLNYTFVPQIGKYNITAVSVSGNQRSIMLDVVKTINASTLVPGNFVATNTINTSSNTLNSTKLGIPSNTLNTTTTKMKPTLSFTNKCSSYNFTANSSCTTIAKIATSNNMLAGTLYLNGNVIGTTNTTINSTVSKPGIYKYTFETLGNGNYINTSINYTFTIYAAANVTSTKVTPSSGISAELIALVILIVVVLLLAYYYLSKGKAPKKNHSKK